MFEIDPMKILVGCGMAVAVVAFLYVALMIKRSK
jgi:hypothetical protein